jgi:hypothetical protein
MLVSFQIFAWPKRRLGPRHSDLVLARPEGGKPILIGWELTCKSQASIPQREMGGKGVRSMFIQKYPPNPTKKSVLYDDSRGSLAAGAKYRGEKENWGGKFFIFLNFFLDPAKKGAVEWL